MSNSFASTSSALYNLKNWYQGPIVDQFNEDTPIYRGAEKSKLKWDGLKVIRPLRVRRNQGIGATSDGGTLPAIGQQKGVQAEVSAKYNYLRFGITGPMIAASMSDKGSFVRQAAFELKQGYKDLQSDANRQCSWDGTGDLALVNTTAGASTTLVVKGRESTEPALKFLDVGMVFDVYTTGGVQEASGIGISSISSGTPTSSTATLVLDTAVSVTADSVLVRSGSYGQEVQGILTQLDGATSTVFGIDRASYPITQGNVVDLNGAQLSLDALQNLWNAGLNRGGAKYQAIFSDFDSQRMYQKLLTADKRYVNSVKGDGGFSSKDQVYLDFNGVPWVADKDCPSRIFMLGQDCIEKMVLKEMAFADEQGSMYIAQTSADSYEVRVRMFFNLFNAQASACGVAVDYVSP
jgi:hypothetical protein